MVKISAVINTFNEESNIERAINSVNWVDEIVVVDMQSDDKTVQIAKKLGAKIYTHKRVGFVEPARNFAIEKAKNEWILVLDADEEIPKALAEQLNQIAEKNNIDFVEIPRKNIIFQKWMRASKWWPDYNIRFFKKESVKWSDKIHSKPSTIGQGLKIEALVDQAIIHHHYITLDQYLGRLFRYTKIQANQLDKAGVNFKLVDLLEKPLNEFLSRFFANRGFEDGLHGFSLSLLQAFSELIVYLRLWEIEKFKEEEIELKDLQNFSKNQGKQISYWFKYGNLSKNPFKRFLQKTKNRLP
jgi:glycosyltransferase involved in cell wall biosynthesis